MIERISMKIFVTGGAGFIGSAFIRYMLKTYNDVEIVNFDALTYAGNLENLQEVERDPRYCFVKGDVTDIKAVMSALEGVDAVVHFAAESHVDRSVLDPGSFLKTNVVGTQILLEACRRRGNIRFHHISTDEVYGELELGEDRAFMEGDPKMPRSPYAASKAASDHIVESYWKTFGLPVTISHCCNNYGPYQFPEKLISLFSTNAIEGRPLPLFRSSQNSREWIHVDDHSSAVDRILRDGRIGDSYNIGTGDEKTVEEITDIILAALDKPQTLKTYVPDRPGHDTRYLVDSTKITNELGWKPVVPLSRGIKETVEWYRDNSKWWQRVKSGAYREYYENYYRETLKANI